MSSLKVAVRVRPSSTRELDMESETIVEMDGKKTRLFKPKRLSIRDGGRENYHDFTFDYSYWSVDKRNTNFITQEQVYNDLGMDVIDCAFQGYNACIFAYGQTGSGKTFTMMGTNDNPGLIPRICQELFARMRFGKESSTGYKTHASYLEIYNERVRDLLGGETSGQALRVREHPNFGSYVENLSQHAVTNFDEIQNCIARGNMQRTTAYTNMNDTSSRSHAIFTITFVQAVFMDEMPSETVSKIHLVDLAGSERANASGATGQRLKEGAHINKSLVTLGSVISALAENSVPKTRLNENSCSSNLNNSSVAKRAVYIPYRDSILTWLLKDSLGGNSKTIMIAALSPADCNYSETLSTLRYANRAKNIINKPTINEDANVKLIRELREEINKLKSMLKSDMHSVQPSLKMIEDLQKKEAQEKVLIEEWAEKWKEAQSILQEQKSLGLRKSGVGVVLDSEMPHLIAIHNDVTTGVTLYSLKEGETLIGNGDSELPQDIELAGDDICSQHCSIILKDGIVTLYPRASAQCWVNANLISEPTVISQGDIILLGRANIFRFNNPAEAAKLRKDLCRSQLDMSRLSLITSSRENLLTSSCCADDDVTGNSRTIAPHKRGDRHYYLTKSATRVELEFQDENRKILETIENALTQLNIERVQLDNHYKTKVDKLSEELQRLEKGEMDSSQLLYCREQELMARKEMLLWEKTNEKIQIDIICRQISALQTQLDLKKHEFPQFILKEIGDVQDIIGLKEVESNECNYKIFCDKILQTTNSLDLNTSQFIKEIIKKQDYNISKMEGEIEKKEDMLNTSTIKIGSIDENILFIQNQLKKLREQGYDTNRSRNTSCNQSSATNTIAPSITSVISLSSATKCNPNKPDSIMSDSGVCLDTLKMQQSNESATFKIVLDKKISEQKDEELDECVGTEAEIHALREKIIAKKMLIMKSIETETDKSKLNAYIAEFQELQRQYIILEQTMGPRQTIMCKRNEISGEDYAKHCDSTSTTSSTCTTIEMHSPVDCFSGPTSHAQALGTVDDGVYSPNMTRSCPSILESTNTEQLITIPSFVIRGAGKHTHYEYEIRIVLGDGILNILRRYSRFRELHLSMKHCYGPKIGALPFPRREVFSSNSESVAKHRRRLLELYLRRLLILCSKIPQCPIYEGPGGPGLTRTTLAQLSPFFKKGLFENGKHGTG